MLKFVFPLIFAVLINCVCGKVFTKCGLAEELMEVYNETLSDTERFLCVAEHSGYSTEYSTNGSFGIFHIASEQLELCNISSTFLVDEDISDDLLCARKLSSVVEQFQVNNSCVTAIRDCAFFNVTTEEESEDTTELPGKAVQANDEDSSTSLVTSSPPEEVQLKIDSRQLENEQEWTHDKITKLLLLHNFAIKHPKPNVNLIFLFV